MKQEFITYKKENKISPFRVFEITVLVFLVCAFSGFLVLMNIEKIEPTIENSDEIAAVFKESIVSYLLGFEKEAKEERNIKEQIIKEYIEGNGEINVFEYFFDIGER